MTFTNHKTPIGIRVPPIGSYGRKTKMELIYEFSWNYTNRESTFFHAISNQQWRFWRGPCDSQLACFCRRKRGKTSSAHSPGWKLYFPMCNLSLTIVGEGRSLASTVWITVLAFLRYLYVEICTLLSAWVFVGFTPAGFFLFFFSASIV